MGRRLRAAAGSGFVVAGPALAVVALHRLGSLPWLQVTWSDLSGWVDRATLEEAIGAAARLIALLAAYWLAASTALYLVASITQVPALVRAAGAVTLPAIRRIVDSMIVTSIALSSMAAPTAAVSLAGDTSVASVMTVVPPQQVVPTESSATTPRSDLSAPAPPPVPIDPISPSPRSAPEPATTDQVDVAPGDNLWALSKRHLADQTGRTPSDAEIHRLWRRVIDLNLDRLRSGDPDLIYPGEVILMPEE